jgi:hypothetical protein
MNDLRRCICREGRRRRSVCKWLFDFLVRVAPIGGRRKSDRHHRILAAPRPRAVVRFVDELAKGNSCGRVKELCRGKKSEHYPCDVQIRSDKDGASAVATRVCRRRRAVQVAVRFKLRCAIVVGQCRPATRHRVEEHDSAHGGLEKSGAGSLSRRQVKPRRRRTRRSRRALARS